MKATKLSVITLAITIILAGIVPITADAETTKTADTTGKVQFKAPTDSSGPVIKPGSKDEEVVPETGNKTTGALRLDHVPSIDFGIVEARAQAQTFESNNEKLVETKEGTSTNLYSPNFIQVTDERGVDGDWKVTVAGTVFAAQTGEKLPNTKISIKEKSSFNNVYDFLTTPDTSDRIEAFSGALDISNDGTAKEVLKTKAGKHTSGSKTSLVFNKDYTLASLPNYEAPNAENTKGKNAGIVLEKPLSDTVTIDVQYTSTLTWTLSSAL